MNIREAKKIDVAQIVDLVRSLAHFYLDNPDNELPAWLAETLTKDAFLTRLQSREYVNFVSEKEGDIIAYISLKKPNHLYHLFVSESFQGQGIARSLWEHLLQNDQYCSLSLRSSVYAIPVYKRFGFKEVGPLQTKAGVSFQSMELHI